MIGAGEPALPGVSIGHNGTIAFGLTIFSIDQEDTYVYRTKPGEPDFYEYRGNWLPMEVFKESVAVRGGDGRAVELRFTHHGPVLYRDPDRNLAIGLRAAWLEPGMAPYLGSIEYIRSRNWDQFLAAMNRWGGALREPGLRRHSRQHRLETGRSGADPAELGRTVAGSRRRPLRVAGLPGHGRTAGRVQPGARLGGNGQRDEPAGWLRRTPGLGMGDPLPAPANRRSAGRNRGHDRRGRGAPASGLRVDSRTPAAGAAADQPGGSRRCRGGTGAEAPRRLERRAHLKQRGRHPVRGLVAGTPRGGGRQTHGRGARDGAKRQSPSTTRTCFGSSKRPTPGSASRGGLPATKRCWPAWAPPTPTSPDAWAPIPRPGAGVTCTRSSSNTRYGESNWVGSRTSAPRPAAAPGTPSATRATAAISARHPAPPSAW